MNELNGSNIEIKGFFRYPFIRPENKSYRASKTPLAADDETWLSLRGKAHSTQQVRKLFSAHEHSNPLAKNVAFFKSYINQADNFYKSSKVLDIKSRPLLLYYCYLNLAKALILLKTNAMPPEGHGFLTDNNVAFSNSPFNKQFVKFKNEGVAVRIFDAYGIDIRDRPLQVSKMMAFITEISGQIVQTKYTYSRTARTAFIPTRVWRLKTNNETFFNLLLLTRSPDKSMPNLSSLKTRFREFHKNYRRVNIDHNSNLAKAWGLNAENIDRHEYYAGNAKKYETYKAMNNEINELLQNHTQESVVNDGHDFYIYVPQSNTTDLYLNEFLATYTLTFFFSEIVRYRPAYLELFSSREDNWLYESFIHTSPLKMLRYFNTLINKDVEILERY